MFRKITTLTVLLCLFFTLMSPAVDRVSAQAQIAVSNSAIQIDYPGSITFSCHVQSSLNITDIRLEYQVEQMSFAQVTSEAKATFTSSTSVNATYTLNMQQYGQIPQGVVINYWWIVKDTGGNKVPTAPNQYIVADNNHKWTNSTQGKINLYWYGQNQSFGQTVMTEAQQALSTLAVDTGATPNKTVNISVYTSSQDYAAAVMGVPEWSGGVELPQYNSILVLIRPTLMDADLPGVAHELTHVIVNQITFNPYNSIPFWLNEGLAVRVQFPPNELPIEFTNALYSAITNNTFISVRSLSDPFSAYTDKAYLSYAESVSIVSYLIEQYGSAKMDQFLITFQQGSTYDGALQVNYGFDMDGLYTRWKAWVKS
jgi:hypothetical protein